MPASALAPGVSFMGLSIFTPKTRMGDPPLLSNMYTCNPLLLTVRKTRQNAALKIDFMPNLLNLAHKMNQVKTFMRSIQVNLC